MPLHKSSRAPSLDSTKISAPLCDFRHTMHVGRERDTFGDISFLLGHGPAGPDQNALGNMPLPGAIDSQTTVNHDSPKAADDLGSPGTDSIQHSVIQHSVSSFTLDLDLNLDLGPSILGDILEVMDRLDLDPDWTSTNEEEVFTPSGGAGTTELVDGRITDENGIKPKGLRPNVGFGDKREEIICQASEEEEGQGFDIQDDDGWMRVEWRRVEICQSEADSDEEEEEEGRDDGRVYTVEDGFDDEIDL